MGSEQRRRPLGQLEVELVTTHSLSLEMNGRDSTDQNKKSNIINNIACMDGFQIRYPMKSRHAYLIIRPAKISRLTVVRILKIRTVNSCNEFFFYLKFIYCFSFLPAKASPVPIIHFKFNSLVVTPSHLSDMELIHIL